jgi:hypothetical protein
VELDETILEFCLWLMMARELGDECPELRVEFPDLIELVDHMQYQSKKIIRSASRRLEEA